MNRWRGVLLPALSLGCLVACATAPVRDTAAPVSSPVPPPSQEQALREGWLKERHGLLLDMMRRHGVGMWVVVNEEFHDDPLTAWVAPPMPYVGNRDVFVFVDAGDAGLQKVALTGYATEAVTRFFTSPPVERKQAEALADLDARYHPRTIALAMDGRRGVTRSLTHDSYKWLVEALGPTAEARFVSAAPLIEEYLDTRLPGEFNAYRDLVVLTESLVKRALSNEVVVPGKTTVGEVRRWLYDALYEARVGTWFQPDLRVQRQGMKDGFSRGFLAVADEAVVIQRGDLLHVDFGVSALGMSTDWQKMAYVLKDGETDAPEGLKRALANTQTLQDALMLRASRPGRSSADVYDATMAEMKEKGIEAKVYSHPLGAQGHALGASIDFRAASRSEAPRLLRKGSYLAVELSTTTPVPEWGGQPVAVMQEDPAYLTDEGWRFFVERQSAFYLIH
ncbi:M24 family metallopeptidase [Corallococcus interemptor]|uniref:M24 family metallopeptidase n=1 Tax=Corallococcus interemptor TaxID=2316720 RepID=A0A3A8QN64_9BACT|nr:M24 family metallopeptidase [Corallococcus interemptor]RKH51283.1 M24 family metallopeptidase [Corallococcus sp. AB050B]RKH69261.1 M24 family metallopeptidase [Corallococcus interemptor]